MTPLENVYTTVYTLEDVVIARETTYIPGQPTTEALVLDDGFANS